ncbi:hypothetical protein GJ496_005280 [Pomphorhynchus laevis]|nr:hypothetical protein GJ496_005280 [Pomphorhynchus laevis]
MYASRTILPLVINDISNDFGWTRFESGIALSSFFWGYSITQVIGGILADHYGGYIIISISTIGWAALTCLLPLLMKQLKYIINPFYVLVLCRILTGCFQGFFYPSLSAISSQEFHKNKSITYSFIISGGYLGTILCGGLGSYILSMFRWSSTFYLFGFVSFVWLIFYQKNFNRQLQENKYRLPTTKVETEPIYSVIIWKPAFWALIFAYLCQNVCFSILFSWLPTYFHDKHPEAKQWVVNVIPWCVSLPLTAMGGKLCDVLAKDYSLTTIRKSATFVSLVCTGLCLHVLTLSSHSLIISLIILMMAISCYSMVTVGLMINPQDICPNNAGTVFGFMNMVGAVPGFTGVLVVGSFLQRSNNDWNTVFRLSSLVCLLDIWGICLQNKAKTLEPIVAFE